MTLILSRAEVVSVLEMKDCIEIVERSFAELAAGTAVLPLRTAIVPPDGLSLYMPAYLKGMGALACKIVTVYKNNPAKHGLPTTIGKVLLQDPASGEVICIMDGGYLTAVRTGAASGVATRHLARQQAGQVVGIFGAGVQAKMQLWGVCEAREVARALVYDVSDAAMDAYVAEMSGKLDLEIVKAASAAEIIAAADIICTATSSPTPLFDGKTIREGTHINGIGSHSPNARELDATTIQRAKLVGDSREACFKEAGDIMMPLAAGEIGEGHFYAELCEIVSGRKAARENDREITLFKSNGLATQDAAAAKLVYEKALAAGIGTQVDM